MNSNLPKNDINTSKVLKQVLEDYTCKKISFLDYRSELIDKYNLSLEKIYLNYKCSNETKSHELILMKKSVSYSKFIIKNLRRTINEQFFLENIVNRLIDDGFNNIPKIYFSHNEGISNSDSYFLQENVGDYNIKEVLSILSNEEINVEKKLINSEMNLLDIPEEIYDKLYSLGRINIVEDKSNKIVRLNNNIKDLYINYNKDYQHILNNKNNVFKSLFDILSDFNDKVTYYFNNDNIFRNKETFIHDRAYFINDFSKTLKRLDYKQKINTNIKKKLSDIFLKDILAMYVPENVDLQASHGDLNIKNVCLDFKKNNKLSLIDFNRIRILRNPYNDFVNLMGDLRTYCGLKKEKSNEFYSEIFGKDLDINHKYITELYSMLSLLGTLNNRIRLIKNNKNRILDRNIAQYDYALKKFTLEGIHLLENWRDLSELKSNSSVGEFNNLLLEHYFYKL